MTKETTSNINLKTGTLITAAAIVVFAVASWALSELYSHLTDEVDTNSGKIDRIEKVLCSGHPEMCKDL